jgi:hypothetical protein
MKMSLILSCGRSPQNHAGIIPKEIATVKDDFNSRATVACLANDEVVVLLAAFDLLGLPEPGAARIYTSDELGNAWLRDATMPTAAE